MGRSTFSLDSYKKVADEVKTKGSATFAGQQRHNAGLKIHELVDPAGYGLIRRSIGPRGTKEEFFKLLRGIAMLEETRLDTTGSMGNNVEIAMEVLPKTYKLLAKGENPVLGKYDVQMMTAIFGDVTDNYVLFRSQAEMDERIAEQMTLMVPEGQGGDSTEDPHYGIFGAAYLTSAEVNRYGLKYYDFTITDADSRTKFNIDTLYRVFGKTVFEKTKENGFNIDKNDLPGLKDVVADLKKNAHAFVLVVNGGWGHEADFWSDIYGEDHVVIIPSVRLLPEIKASIIGLTEGVLSLQDLDSYLKNICNVNDSDAEAIIDAISHIPIGAQTQFENFDKLPKAGDLFESKTSLYPIENESLPLKKEDDSKIDWE